VPSEVSSHFAATGGVTNVNGIWHVKCFDKRGHIIGVRVLGADLTAGATAAALRFQEGQ
jgi:hypothetical protein